MTEDWFSDALRDRISQDEPPMGITAKGAMQSGRRLRQRQLVGASVAAIGVGAVLLSAAYTFDPGPADTAGLGCGLAFRTVAPTPLPSGSDFPGGEYLPGVAPSADVGSSAGTGGPAGPSAGPSGPGDLGETAQPGLVTGLSGEKIDQFTCAVQTSIVTALPDAKFAPVNTIPQQPVPPLQPGVSMNYLFDGLYIGAVAVDRLGQGSIVVEAGRVERRPEPDRCGDGRLCTLRTGPHGEVIEVYERIGPIVRDGYVDVAAGVIGYTIYVYTGQTAIVASTHNTPDAGGRFGVSRPTPPLTLDQLIDLACDPALVVWP